MGAILISWRKERRKREDNHLDFDEGEMLEWLKRHAWKACIRQKRIRGSNPRLSAKKILIN